MLFIIFFIATASVLHIVLDIQYFHFTGWTFKHWK